LPVSEAQQAIGAYFCAFSALEQELGETVKVIFRLQTHEAADTIIAALDDFSRKVRLVRAAVAVAKNADGSETSAEWKTAADQTMTKILGVNENDRVLLAHSLLEAKDDGSVQFTRLHLPGGVLKNRQQVWTKPEFEKKIGELTSLTRRLQDIKRDLSTFTINLPNLGWMTIDTFQPTAGTHSQALKAITEPASNWPPTPSNK
jgi:hypothetical protein